MRSSRGHGEPVGPNELVDDPDPNGDASLLGAVFWGEPGGG